MDGFEQEVPLLNSKQYPSVPKVMFPLKPLTDMAAFRKKIDLKYGTQNETTAKRTVAARVTRKPGVAGRMRPIVGAAAKENESWNLKRVPYPERNLQNKVVEERRGKD